MTVVSRRCEEGFLWYIAGGTPTHPTFTQDRAKAVEFSGLPSAYAFAARRNENIKAANGYVGSLWIVTKRIPAKTSIC